jgi:hypothetical protein
MVKATKTPKRPAGTFTVGRDKFSKISAVEGIKLSPRVAKDFGEFDRKGLTAEERRREISRKYGQKN